MDSSVTSLSSSSGFILRSLSIQLVETVRSHTIGAKIFATQYNIPDMPRAIPSDFFIATLLGTSSPNTRVKYASIRVMTTTETTLSIIGETVTPIAMNLATITSAKLSAATALCSRLAKVMATCIVARNLAGCTVRLTSLLALLSPSSAIFLNLTSFMDITAISVAANIAFKPIRITSKIIAFIFLSSTPFDLIVKFYHKKAQKPLIAINFCTFLKHLNIRLFCPYKISSLGFRDRLPSQLSSLTIKSYMI